MSRFQAHPWHGVEAGPLAPHQVTSFIEIVPTDAVKYEVDKASGLLKVDRPQKYSNAPPSLYGFVPQTYCAEEVAKRCMARTKHKNVIGDGDPLDICVLTEKPITHGDILVQAVPIGGLRMVDKREADDKIIAVLLGDAVYGGMKDLDDCPTALIERLRHYFLTYKQSPDQAEPTVEIAEVYDRAEAMRVIEASLRDYQRHFEKLKAKR